MRAARRIRAPIADIRWTAEPVGFDLLLRFKAAERRKVVEIGKDWPRTIAGPLLMGGPISEPQAKRGYQVGRLTFIDPFERTQTSTGVPLPYTAIGPT